ncbi:MAG: hypothetical protein [Microviridae sp.]|nr:MAG: hypothetical protein [Microviridae sp.]
MKKQNQETQRRHLVSASTYKLQNHHLETNEMPDECIQGQAFTIREIIERFSRGARLEIAHNQIFDGEEDFDNYDVTRDGSFELADASELSAEISARNEAKKASQKARQVAKAQQGSEADEPSQSELPMP